MPIQAPVAYFESGPQATCLFRRVDEGLAGSLLDEVVADQVTDPAQPRGIGIAAVVGGVYADHFFGPRIGNDHRDG